MCRRKDDEEEIYKFLLLMHGADNLGRVGDMIRTMSITTARRDLRHGRSNYL